MTKLTRYFFVIIGVTSLIACSNNARETGRIKADFSNKSKTDPSSLFALVDSKYSGVRFKNEIIDYPGLNINTYDNYYSGGGVAIGDINNDGLSDIFFTGNLEPNRLYLNLGDFVFEDISELAGITDEEYWSTGVSMVDINNDGWLDIYICHSGQESHYSQKSNHLYINNRDNTFTERSRDYGLVDNNFSAQAVFFDYDVDGDVDLFLANRTDFQNRFQRERSFGAKIQAVEEFMTDEKNKVKYSNRLFQNDGNGKFKDITEEAGLLRWGFSHGLSSADLNKDGYPDLYVANDYFVPDFYYVNNGDGTFSEENKNALGHNSHFSMGLDVADFNNDSWPDFSIVDMVSSDRVRNKTLMNPMNERTFLYVTQRLKYQDQYMFNVFQKSNGNGTFSEVGQMMGLTQTDWSWSTLLNDYDLDGDKDVFITNGFRRDTKNRDVKNDLTEQFKRIPINGEIFFTDEEVLHALSHYPSVPLTNYLYSNEGGNSFVDISKDWGFIQPSFSNGAAYGDLDNDGDLDLVISNIDHEAFIYKNQAVDQQRGNYLKIDFDSDSKNLNAKVTVYSNGEMQYQEFTPVRGYLSSVEPSLIFGFGPYENVDSIHVEWLYNKEVMRTNVPLNQTVRFSINDTAVTTARSDKPRNKKIFEEVDINSMGVDYTHFENPFWDFRTEVLLPHRQSRNGPHLSVADVTGNGLEDFFIGGAKEQQGVIFIQYQEGKFRKANSSIWQDRVFSEDIGSCFFDFDQDGDKDLYVVSGGGGDFDANSTDLEDRLYRNEGNGNFILTTDLIPRIVSSGSRVKNFDFDKDGDQDLFVGGRVIPGNYPASPKSFILRNDNGKFTDVTIEISPGLNKIGMVTDFQWTDFSGDGMVDLVVVGEWMRIELFEQINGSFVNVTDKWMPKDSRGWWFSTAAADFDQDGDIDLVAGNLGLNNKFHATEQKPLEIFFNDFDDNGTYDIVLAKTDDQGENYALRGKDCSTQQMPFIKDKFPKYEDFAMASLDDVFPDAKIESALHYAIHDFSSVYLENVDGQFEIKQLPVIAQFAPIQDILVDDFDGDGLLDMVVAGNLFDTEIETASYDAGTGVYLKGDGQNNFMAFAVHESGLYLGKNLKDMELITIKGEKYILGANNNDMIDLVKVNRTNNNIQ